MTDTSISDAVAWPQDDGTGVADGSEDFNSAGYLGLLAQARPGKEFVDNGLEFTNVDTTNETVDITKGHAYLTESGNTVQSGSQQTYDTTLPAGSDMAYAVTLPTTVTIGLDTDAVNDIYLALDPTSNDGVYVRHGSAVSAPTDPHIKLGTVDTAGGSTTRANDTTGLEPIVSAADYDGADGGTKIQNALDDLSGGGTVYIPADGPDANGRWDVSSKIVPYSNQTIVGEAGQTTLRAVNALNDDVIQTAADDTGTTKENITIADLVIDGNKANQDTNNAGTKLFYYAGIRLVDVEHCRVQNVKAFDCTGYGVEVKVSQNVHITDVESFNHDDDGISVTDTWYAASITRNVTIKDSHAYGNADGGMEVDDGPQHVVWLNCHSEDNGDYGFGVHTHGTNGPTSQDEVAPQDIYWVNCLARGSHSLAGIMMGPHSGTGPARGYKAENCTVYSGNNTGKGISLASPNAVSTTLIQDVEVSGCTIHMNGSEDGIWGENGAGINGITIENCTFIDELASSQHGHGICLQNGAYENVLIDNCRSRSPNNRMGYGILIYANSASISKVTITDCEMRECNRSGILLATNNTNSLDDFVVADNRCYDNGQGNGNDHQIAGICIEALSDGNSPTGGTVNGNRCWDDGAGTQQYGIRHSGCDEIAYTGNSLRGNVTSSFSGTAGTNSVKSGNVT